VLLGVGVSNVAQASDRAIRLLLVCELRQQAARFSQARDQQVLLLR
jgi:hypothetical protein